MKKVYLFLLISLLFGCSSVKKIENPISLDYSSSKAGIINLTKNLSLYYKESIRKKRWMPKEWTAVADLELCHCESKG